jgi:ribonuclease P protein component
MRMQSLEPGWDIVFIARSSAVESGYHELESTVAGLLNRARLLEANE